MSNENEQQGQPQSGQPTQSAPQSGQQPQQSGQRQPPPMQVKGNFMYLNSAVYKKEATYSTPYQFFVAWYTNNRGEKDMCTIKIVFFTDVPNHPISTAQKGDIIRFDVGTLKYKTRMPETRDAQGKPVGPDTVVYAEILVHEQLSVERVDRPATQPATQQAPVAQPAPAANPAPVQQQPANPPVVEQPVQQAAQQVPPPDTQQGPPAAPQSPQGNRPIF